MSTKKELEKEIHQLTQEKLLWMGKYRKAQDRKKLAALYLQTLRLTPDYTDGKEGTFITYNDYDRLLAILEADRYPEGF